jgi:DNA-binding transcriptional ArsR family regulator
MQHTIAPEQPRQGTTAESLHDVFCCWTRVEVMIAVAGERRAVAELAAVLRLGRPLVSAHLSDLADAGLVWRQAAGKKHYYELTRSAQVLLLKDYLELFVRAEDGSEMTFKIPRSARIMRLLGTAIRLLEPSAVTRAAPTGNDTTPAPPT